jgi:hypothetical protein
MELVLNLAWLLLAVPGYWLWRRRAADEASSGVSSLQFLLALGCGLVLLFPVISATDDLHAMRAEMEESSAKRAVRQAAAEKSSTAVNRLQESPALLMAAYWLAPPQVGGWQMLVPRLVALSRECAWHVRRAPPISLA